MIWVFIVVLVAALLLYAVVARGGSKTAKPRGSRSHLDRSLVAERWQSIEVMSSGGGGAKAAISEADKLFDYVLKGMGFPGQTMAERLKRAESRLSNRNAVWQAHKLRNALAHEVGFEVSAGHAREAIDAFHRGLQDLGVL